MVDPVSAAAVAAATLFATKLVEGAGSKAGEAVTGLVGKLIGLIRRKAAADPETGAAVTLVEAKPADEGRVTILGTTLAAQAASDPAFAQELLALVSEAHAAGLVTIGGQHVGNVFGGTVNQGGRDQYNAQGDQVFGRDDRQR